jgi:hypothetical protein
MAAAAAAADELVGFGRARVACQTFLRLYIVSSPTLPLSVTQPVEDHCTELTGLQPISDPVHTALGLVFQPAAAIVVDIVGYGGGGWGGLDPV